MILRQYKAEDAIEILSAGVKQPGLNLDPCTTQWAELKETRGPAVTAVEENRIIGCSGIEICWPGFAEIWCIFVEDIEKYGLKVALRIKPLVKKWIKENNLVRLQAPLRADFPEGIRMAEWVGFKYEATLQKYHPDGVDALMYVIIGE